MFLGGLAFGLGCASKWTGIYAGAGLAVLYLGVLYARWRQGKPGFAQEFRTAFLGGVVFYVVMPLCIYIASYLSLIHICVVVNHNIPHRKQQQHKTDSLGQADQNRHAGAAVSYTHLSRPATPCSMP